MGTVWDTLAPRNLELGPLAEAERDGATSPWRNWRLAHDEDGIAWLALDKAGASANTLAVDVLSELDKVLASLEKNVPKGLVLRSAKPSGFIAGADIGEFRGLTDAAMVEERLSEAHAVSIASIGWARRRSPSFTAIASGADSRSRSLATIASRSRMRGSDFPRSCSAYIPASVARCACRGSSIRSKP